jgi:hypothetical protein
MKKFISLLLLSLLLVGCSGGEKTFDFTVAEYEERVGNALNQMDIGLSVLSSEENEDGRQVLSLSEDVFIFIDKDGDKPTAVSLAAMPNVTETDDIYKIFTLLVGTVDDSLSLGDRNLLINDLGLRGNNLLDYTEVINHNNIQYTYKGTAENVVLQAKPK